MNYRRFWVTLLTLLALFIMTGADVLAQADKVDVCHRRGNGSYHLINISSNALDAHLGHGDALPGDPFPGQDGFIFGVDCSPLDAGPTLVVTEGRNADPEAGLRFSGVSNSNVWLGVESLLVLANRVSADAGNPFVGGAFTLVYDGDTTLGLTGPGAVNLVYNLAAAPTCWDSLLVIINDESAQGGVGIQQLQVNGELAGDFPPETNGEADRVGRPLLRAWTVTGVDFSQPFTVMGMVDTEDLNDGNFVWAEIMAGCAP